MTITRGTKGCVASLLSLVVALFVTSGVSARPPADDGGLSDYSGQKLRFIVPTAAGGGFDTTLRQLQPYLEEQLNATLEVQNLDGAATAIGTSAGLSAEQNCMTVIFHGVPHLTFSYLTQNVDYDLDSFAPIGGISIEPGVLRVRDNAPWKDFDDLIADAKKRPGRIRVSVSLRTSNNYVGMRDIEQAYGVRFNIISYDGGGPSRNALLSGEVDVTHAGVFNSLGLEDSTRVIGIQQRRNRWAGTTDDAPTLTTAGGEPIPENSSRYTLWAPRACRDDYPKRYAAMTEALRKAMNDRDYRAELAAIGEETKLDYLNPDELWSVARNSDEEIRGILKEDPDAFTAGS